MNLISDEQIRAYISEKKAIPRNFNPVLKDKKCGHSQSYNEFIGENGNTFIVSVRQSNFNPLDFTVIFGVMISGKIFKLARYNGDHGEHTNKITGESFSGCHIHKATQIYQENGFEEEGFAEQTTRYSDLKTALNKMFADNNFQIAVEREQRRL